MVDSSSQAPDDMPPAQPDRPRTPLGDWTRRLRKEPARKVATIVDQVDAIDTDVLDSAIGFAAEHVRRYIASAGEDDGWDGPKPILILYTKGRKSGRYRRHPLLMFEHQGQRFVVGSKGGEDQPPAWLINLQSDPLVHVRVMAAVYSARAELVSDAARAAMWPTLTRRYPMFAEYQAATTRQIPLVRLIRSD